MLPRLPPISDIKSKNYDLSPPPEILTVRGVDNLKLLKEYSAEAFLLNSDLLQDLKDKSEQLSRSNALNESYSADISHKLGLISDLKQRLERETISVIGRQESERLMMLETKLRKETEAELEKTRQLLETEKQLFIKFKQYRFLLTKDL